MEIAILLGGLFLVMCYGFYNPKHGVAVVPQASSWGVLEVMCVVFLLAIVGFFLLAAFPISH